MEITLCLIVKNEEQKLPACLNSLQGVFHKLVIIDTGSTDRTVEIAREFGAELFDFTWVKNFSSARNFALSKIKTDWTMMVDADDTLEEKSKEKLILTLQNLPSDVQGVFLPYLYSNVSNGRGTMAYLPRIWKTDLELKYILPIHEYLDVPRGVLSHFVRLDFPLVHHKTGEDFSKSFMRNVEILEYAYVHGDRHPRILFYLGHDNFYGGHVQDSLKWFQKFLRLKTRHPHEAYKAHMMISKIFLELGDTPAAIKSYRKAIKVCPDFLDAHILLGDLLAKNGNYSKAVQCYTEALGCKPPRTHIFLNTHLDYAYAQRRMHETLKALEKKHQ